MRLDELNLGTPAGSRGVIILILVLRVFIILFRSGLKVYTGVAFLRSNIF